MSSSGKQSLVNLERDIPTTEEDIAALRRAAATPVEDPFAAVQQLSDALPPEARRPRRETHEGWPAFEL